MLWVLLENLESENIKCILTQRLNLDCLKNLLCRLRLKGGLLDPTPLNALYRLRSILVGKDPDLVQENTNIVRRKGTENEHFSLANVLQQARVEVNIAPPHVKDNLLLSSSSSETLKNVTEDERYGETLKDGLEYIAGWLAYKFKGKYPHLSDPMKCAPQEHSYMLPSWIRQLSFGGLASPSTDFLMQVKIMERCFQKLVENPNFINKNNMVQKVSHFIEFNKK